MSETWKRIWDIPGDYRVSSDGRVRNEVTGRLMTPHLVNGKTMMITLGHPPKGFSLPRKVLTLFRPIAHANLYYAAHKDDDPRNCRLDNLEWRYKGVYFSSLTEDDVRRIRVLWATSQASYRHIGAQFNISAASVGLIVRGDAWGDVPD